MVPEDRRRPRVRHDVRVSLHLEPLGEPPVPLRAPRVVVLDERNRAARPAADDARRLPFRVREAPVLLPLEHRVKDALRGDVERPRGGVRVVHPRHDALPVVVLVIRRLVVVVRESVPKLPHGEVDVRRLHVIRDVLPAEPADVVEAPAVVPNLRLHPLHPRADVALDEILRVVDVGRGVEKVAAVSLKGVELKGVSWS
eukprot:31165-Pelagococcus_subviridis.AAC.1